MAFNENLRQIRKERHLSQEDLAELLDVSRQAVSKWEQGQGYPEVEKLLILSEKLDCSLDRLMGTNVAENDYKMADGTGEVIITSHNENVIAMCYKVASTGKIPGGKSSPKYALFGISRGNPSFWGEPTTFLGWYVDKEEITKEISEIQKAIICGSRNYELKYNAITERRWGRIRLISE